MLYGNYDPSPLDSLGLGRLVLASPGWAAAYRSSGRAVSLSSSDGLSRTLLGTSKFW